MWGCASAIVPIMETKRGIPCCVPLKVGAKYESSVMVIMNKLRTEGLVFGDAPAITLTLILK
jgi:hypothetical protein